jgi:hypothetical protein
MLIYHQNLAVNYVTGRCQNPKNYQIWASATASERVALSQEQDTYIIQNLGVSLKQKGT